MYGLAFGAGAIWVSAFDSQYLYRIDPATNRVSARIEVGMEQAEVTATSTAVWVAVFGQGDVVKVDPATNAVVARIHVGGQPEEVTLAAGAAWVPNENRTVARIDLATNAVVARIRVGADPDYAVFCRGRLWVTSLRGSRLSLIDPAKNRVARQVKVGLGSAGIACGRSVWLANYDTGRSCSGSILRRAR